MNIVSNHISGCGIEQVLRKNLYKTNAGQEVSYEQYQVQLGDHFTPVLDEYKELAASMDKNRNGIVEASEILPEGTTRMGNIQIDQPDYTFGVKHHLAGWANPYADAYPSAARVADNIDRMQQEHPDLVHKTSLGKTAEGRDIWAVRIGKEPQAGKPEVLVIGGHHAREWAGNGAVTSSMEKMLDAYGRDPKLTADVDAMDHWFVPLANPDGYEFSRNADPGWRKNRSHHHGIDGVGVDLNRNYRADFRFPGDSPNRIDDDEGASDDPNQLTYRGPHALSEHESQAITDFIDTHPNLKGVLDVHGFGRMILYPGAASKERQDHYAKVADKINEALDVKYTPLAIPDLYPTTGDLSAYAEKRGVLSMALEIGTSFQPSPDKKDDIVERGSQAIMSYLDQVSEHKLA